MNYWFIFAGILLFLSLLVHMLVGDKEYRGLNPGRQGGRSENLFGFWLMGRCTFQMVSVDLLLSAVFIFLMGVNVVPYNSYLVLFVVLLYAGYLVFWLLTLLASKARPENYLKQGQWMLFLIALVLIVFGCQGKAY